MELVERKYFYSVLCDFLEQIEYNIIASGLCSQVVKKGLQLPDRRFQIRSGLNFYFYFSLLNFMVQFFIQSIGKSQIMVK